MTEQFIGRGWAFPLRTDATGGIALVSREREIEEAIRLILGHVSGRAAHAARVRLSNPRVTPSVRPTASTADSIETRGPAGAGPVGAADRPSRRST